MVTDNKVYENVIWPYRLLGNLFLMGVIWFTTCAVITIRHNLVGKQIDSLLQDLYIGSATIGWGLEDITLEGREKTSAKDILQAVNLKRGDNILEIDLDAVREQIEMLPWIKEVAITRRYFPNVLQKKKKKKNVKSIWQYKNEFYPIDEEGQIIETEYVPQKNILQIVGEEAPENLNKLLKIIEQDKELFSRIKAASFISKRRWNLIFDDVERGVTVKLPEDNMEEAWKKLIKLDKTRGILKRKLTFIDLRLKDKVIVRLNKEDNELR